MAQLRTVARGFVTLLSVLLAFAVLTDGPAALPLPPAKSSAALSADNGDHASDITSAVATTQKHYRPSAVNRPKALTAGNLTSRALQQPAPAGRRGAAEPAEGVPGDSLPAAHHQGAHRHRPGELPAVLQVLRC